jgi:hypothetical protein
MGNRVLVPNFGITSATSTIATSQTTTSSSYTDLATVGPAVTLTTGNKALVIVTANIYSSVAGYYSNASFAVSGATTISAANTNAARVADTGGVRCASATVLTTLTKGSNTFTMKYSQSAGGTGTFFDREIIVIDLGS